MARTIGIDFGLKRIGMATTDPLGISVQGKGTFSPDSFGAILKTYLDTEEVDKVVIGRPSKPSEAFTRELDALVKRIAKLKPDLEVVFHDEDFSSKEAVERMKEMGVKKNKRNQVKDQVSAVLILQDFLGHRSI